MSNICIQSLDEACDATNAGSLTQVRGLGTVLIAKTLNLIYQNLFGLLTSVSKQVHVSSARLKLCKLQRFSYFNIKAFISENGTPVILHVQNFRNNYLSRVDTTFDWGCQNCLYTPLAVIDAIFIP